VTEITGGDLKEGERSSSESRPEQPGQRAPAAARPANLCSARTMALIELRNLGKMSTSPADTEFAALQ
jgi:hypothetical protein